MLPNEITFLDRGAAEIGDGVAFLGIRDGGAMRFRITHEALTAMSGEGGTALTLFTNHKLAVYDLARRLADPLGGDASGFVLISKSDVVTS